MTKMNWLEKFFVNSWIINLFHKWFGVQKLLLWCRLDEAKNILELGCGKGTTTGYISKHFKNATITATDFDEGQISLAKKIKNVTFAIADASSLNYKHKQFDTVIEVLAFHHVKEYKKAIEESYRILKKGGNFIALEMGGMFHSPFSKKEFIQLLEDAGFTVEKHKGRIIFSVQAVK